MKFVKVSYIRIYEIDKIVETFLNRDAVEDFSVAVTYAEIIAKNYSLSAGQYFDVTIDYVEITPEEFQTKMNAFKSDLQKYFAESVELQNEISRQLENLVYEKI